MTKDTIRRKSLADEVAARLQQQIALGKYKVDEQLPIEPELMKQFGVGRSTIREAIKILVNSGLLRVQQGLGTFVDSSTANKEPLGQRLKRADVKDLDEVRQLLEMKIAEKAALNRTTADLKKMRQCLVQRRQAAEDNQLQECIDADIRFHTAVAEASKNDILADLYKSAAIHVANSFRQSYKSTDVFKKSHQLHEELLRHIEAGEARKAWNSVAKIIGHLDR
ncbi:MAG: FadR family transcriptional regulator [Bacteroidetes bacterium]|nr:FadR family transcriptional regulator [Bacteroidota bacterium]